MKDIQGGGVKKKLAAQRLNNIDACISSCACVLNSDERMKQVRQANQVVKIISDTKRDKEVEKTQKLQKKLLEEAEKTQKKLKIDVVVSNH
eukprot:3762953-Ditylum_brightwellii.AAC.1